VPQFPGIASAHVSNQRCDENVANCTLHAEAIFVGRGKNYANLHAVVFQSFSKLSTVIDSTNQILIPGAGIMERRYQWNVYRLSRHFLVTRPLSARPAHKLFT